MLGSLIMPQASSVSSLPNADTSATFGTQEEGGGGGLYNRSSPLFPPKKYGSLEYGGLLPCRPAQFFPFEIQPQLLHLERVKMRFKKAREQQRAAPRHSFVLPSSVRRVAVGGWLAFTNRGTSM